MINLLWKRGVYVQKLTGVLIPLAPLDVMKKDIPWSDNKRESAEQENNIRDGNQEHEGDNRSDEDRTGKDSRRHGNERSKEDCSNFGSKGGQYHGSDHANHNRAGISNLSKEYNIDADRYIGMLTDSFDRKMYLF